MLYCAARLISSGMSLVIKFGRFYCLCLILLTGITACAPVRHKEIVYTNPPQLILQNHPLANRIYDVKTGRMITAVQLYQRLAAAKYILVGETHDNTAQHAVETSIIDYLAGLHRPTSVSFEMIDDVQGRLLADKPVKSAAALIALLKRGNSGWEYKIYYKELFEHVIRGGLRILPANLNRAQLLGMMNEHVVPVPAAQKDLMSHTPLSRKNLNEMQQELLDSHCGVLRPAQVRPMIRGQRIRDATMALSLLHSNAQYRVLIAGDGHVRKDLGVPRYIHDPGARLVSVGVLEVDKDLKRPRDYAQNWGNGQLPFDYVWFTPRAQRKDPCIEFIKNHSPDK